MMGGRRVVRVRGAGNGLADLFEGFLDDPPGDALVVVEAGDLAKGAALRKLFEEDDKPPPRFACYADTARNLEDVVREALRAEGLSIAPDALADAVSRLGSDRGVTRRELEKLALYAKGQKSDQPGRCARRDGRRSRGPRRRSLRCGGQRRFCPARSGAGAAMDGGHGGRRGDPRRHGPFPAPGAGARRHGAGRTIWTAPCKQLRPPVHFLRADSFKAQARRWSGEQLGDALDMLLEAEALAKTTAVPAEAVCGRTLMNIAAMAKGRM